MWIKISFLLHIICHFTVHRLWGKFLSLSLIEICFSTCQTQSTNFLFVFFSLVDINFFIQNKCFPLQRLRWSIALGHLTINGNNQMCRCHRFFQKVWQTCKHFPCWAQTKIKSRNNRPNERVTFLYIEKITYSLKY